MKRIWDVAGLRGAVATHALCTAAFLTLVASSCLIAGMRRDEETNPLLPVIIATVAAAFLSLPFLSFRPVTMAIVLLAAITWLLIRDRAMEEKSRSVWLIPALTALIQNLHIFAILAPLWVTALLVGS